MSAPDRGRFFAPPSAEDKAEESAPFLSYPPNGTANGLSHAGGGGPSAGDARDMGPLERHEKKRFQGAPAILSYCVSSIMMTVANKFIVKDPNFNLNLVVLMLQSLVGVLLVLIARQLGWIQLRGLNKRDVGLWFPISVLLAAVIYTGSKALQHLKVSVYTIFKNLTIVLIAYGEKIWFSGKITPMTGSAFALMILSSVVAYWADTPPVPKPGQTIPSKLNDSLGYIWMACNCFCSAAYVLLMRKRIKVTGFKDWDSMYYNNALTIPVLLVLSWVVETWTVANFDACFPSDKRNGMISAILFSGACAMLISFTTAWCIRVTSSTTYSMTGALNKLPLSLSGMLFFGEHATPGNALAIAMGFGAGVVYAVAKVKQSAEKSSSLPAPVSAPQPSREASPAHDDGVPLGRIPERRD